MIEQISLFFTAGSSDKFYNIGIEKIGDGYMVPFTYGRRGTSGQSGYKTKSPVTLDVAKKAYDKAVKEKMRKGYVEGDSGTSGTTHSGITVEVKDTGIFPQLLNPIEDDEVEKYLKDPRYCAQEKKDGRRKFMKREGDETVSINRKGLAVGYPACFDLACSILYEEHHNFLIDGEEIGNTLHVFDLLSIGDRNIKMFPYIERYEILKDMMELLEGKQSAFKLVPIAVTEADKRELYDRLRKEEKEGIIFKLLDAPYTSGRPNSYGPQVKNKFYATASCIVLKQNVQRSIQMGVYNDKDVLTFVGNCTISPDKDVPEVNDIIEVRYLYAYRGGSLYQPTFRMLRDDIDKTDCKITQLKYKAEEN